MPHPPHAHASRGTGAATAFGPLVHRMPHIGLRTVRSGASHVHADHTRAQVHNGRPSSRPPLLVGSIKGHIGHTNTAAGIASFVKACLAVHHGEVPPTAHSHQPTTLFEWSTKSMRLAAAPTVGVRCVGVSAFGIGGTNAHVVLHAPSTAARRDAMVSVSMAPATMATEAVATDAAEWAPPSPLPRPPAPFPPSHPSSQPSAPEPSRQLDRQLLYEVAWEPTAVAEAYFEMLPIVRLDDGPGAGFTSCSEACAATASFLSSLELSVPHHFVSWSDAAKHVQAQGVIALVGGAGILGYDDLARLTWQTLELMEAIGRAVRTPRTRRRAPVTHPADGAYRAHGNCPAAHTHSLPCRLRPRRTCLSCSRTVCGTRLCAA